MTGDVQDQPFQAVGHRLRRKGHRQVGGKSREEAPIGRHAARDPWDHVARFAEGGGHPDGVIDRQVARDLRAAHAVAQHDDALAAEGVTAAVVEAVHHLAREALEPLDHRPVRPVEAPARDHDAVEALAAAVAGDDTPASVVALDASDRRLQTNRSIKIEGLRIGAEIVAEILEARKHGHRLRGREVRERVQRLAGVGAHPRPDAAVGRRGVPLAAHAVGLLEDDGLETLLLERLGGDQAARAGPDNRHATSLVTRRWHGPSCSAHGLLRHGQRLEGSRGTGKDQPAWQAEGRPQEAPSAFPRPFVPGSLISGIPRIPAAFESAEAVRHETPYPQGPSLACASADLLRSIAL